MLQGDFASSGRAEKLLSSCNPCGEPHWPTWLKIAAVSSVQGLSRVPETAQMNQVLVGIEATILETVGRQPVLEVLRILVDQCPFSAPVTQLQQRQPVLHGNLLAHLLSQRRVGLAIGAGNFAESVVQRQGTSSGRPAFAVSKRSTRTKKPSPARSSFPAVAIGDSFRPARPRGVILPENGNASRP